MEGQQWGKLRQLGVTNWIINDSDSDDDEFGQKLETDSDSKVEIGWCQFSIKINQVLNKVGICLIEMLKLGLFFIIVY